MVSDIVYIPVGKHFLVEFFGCLGLLDDVQLLEKYLLEAVKVGSMTVVDTKVCLFEPQGVTAVVVLKESHLVLHTYPEYKYCRIDCDTCGREGEPEKIIFYLEKIFLPTKIKLEFSKIGFF